MIESPLGPPPPPALDDARELDETAVVAPLPALLEEEALLDEATVVAAEPPAPGSVPLTTSDAQAAAPTTKSPAQGTGTPER